MSAKEAYLLLLLLLFSYFHTHKVISHFGFGFSKSKSPRKRIPRSVGLHGAPFAARPKRGQLKPVAFRDSCASLGIPVGISSDLVGSTFGGPSKECLTQKQQKFIFVIIWVLKVFEGFWRVSKEYIPGPQSTSRDLRVQSPTSEYNPTGTENLKNL